MTEPETITSGPLAGCTVERVDLTPADVFNPTERYLLALNDRGELGYLAAQQEWVDDHGDPLQEAEQWAADELARGGFLPQFAEWFPEEGGENGGS